ncbi:GIN domain-containing protein [Desulforamulus ruminis]|uniref:GIN domain-containing protein n=1 Tax=Desulforamulus ruminis TaxID=1564 RepID=UPI002357E9AB|nr:DUF2807 domain-containing protein [Desulforamulus ruminis]
MRQVHQYQDLMVLSQKEVSIVAGSRAWFEDGSTADLKLKSVKNCGPGEIKFRPVFYKELGGEMKNREYKIEDCREMIFSGNHLFFEIQLHSQPYALLEVMGTEGFHGAIRVTVEGQGCLSIHLPLTCESSSGHPGSPGHEPIEGRLLIKVPRSVSLTLDSTGRGRGIIGVPLDRLQAVIRGSMRLDCQEAGAAEIHMQGSGRVYVEQVRQTLKVNIAGTGDVAVTAGSFKEMQAEVSGSGSLVAGVTVERAELLLKGTGDIVVGHILEHSLEAHQGPGKIIVLKRGRA